MEFQLIGKQFECFSIAIVNMIGYFVLDVLVLAAVSVEVWQIGGIDNMDDIFVWGYIGGECEWIDLGVE